jgi:L-fuculose-phosphate aldolase
MTPRDELCAAMERIYSFRMTTSSGGNLSIREPDGDVWITPAGIDKGALRPEDIVRVGGPGRPSSELPLHEAVYRERPDLRGIVHAHPVALVAFSLVHEVPDTRLFHQARQVCGEAGFAPYRLPGSGALGESVAAAFAAGHDCVILENHGVVTGGASLQEAFRRFETFEFVARTLIRARLLGREPHLLGDDELALVRTDALPRGPRGEAHAETRAELCGFVHRAYRQRLFISTQGSFSARVGDDAFLVTPRGIDRGTVRAEQLVLVADGRAEAGETPSRAAGIHRAIYRAHPEVGAIVNAYPPSATAFSVTRSELETRTIPESYVVVRRPGRAGFAQQFEAPESLAALVSLEVPALMLESNGVLVTGATVLEAFDRLEVLESTAQALIESRALGEVALMSDEVIRELDDAFS